MGTIISKDGIQVTSCKRKKAFQTKRAARKAKKAAQKARGCKLWEYRCPTCGQFHLTSVPRRS